MKVLVAGIGNVLFGDDGFGVEVARHLAGRPMPAGVRVVDFGIRGLDLTFALLGDYDAAILVDTVRRGGPPGTVYVIEPAEASGAGDRFDAHGFTPVRALEAARSMGEPVRVVRVVGCEPSAVSEDADFEMGLTPPVAAAVGAAANAVCALLAELGGEALGA